MSGKIRRVFPGGNTSKGYDVEFHHCSSDVNSIDAIVVPKLRVAMLDGTAPHAGVS